MKHLVSRSFARLWARCHRAAPTKAQAELLAQIKFPCC